MKDHARRLLGPSQSENDDSISLLNILYIFVYKRDAFLYRNAFLFTTATPFLLTNATQILTLLLLLLWTTLAKPQLNEDVDWKESLMLEQKLTKLQSKTDSVKGKKENQGLENLHAKQLLHLLSLHLLLMIPTLLFLFSLIDLITSFWILPWYQGVFQFQKHVCILLIQVGCNDILLKKWIFKSGNSCSSSKYASWY